MVRPEGKDRVGIALVSRGRGNFQFRRHLSFDFL
jgi:hypothetical protein